MTCNEVQTQIGLYVDGELSDRDRAAVDAHVAECGACRRELFDLKNLEAALAGGKALDVPGTLWASIAARLEAGAAQSASGQRSDEPAAPSPAAGAALHRPRRSVGSRLRSGPWSLAALLALAVGLGFFAATWTGSAARAEGVNFSVLLDSLPLDAEKAFRKFLVLYRGEIATPVEAKRYAPGLRFALPETLPGGFRLQEVYTLKFGNHPGVAATYDRNGEFLGAIFHPPVQREDFGTHRDYECVVGKHRGHKVEVGQWKLVHLTDPTTCHCVLSRLDENTELPPIMAAVAPNLPESGATHDHDHDHP